jgi:hypothetical protein
MKKPTRKQIEKAANAIRLLVPTNCRLNELGVVGWTAKGVAEIEWPTSFTKEERAVIRKIAKTALGG